MRFSRLPAMTAVLSLLVLTACTEDRPGQLSGGSGGAGGAGAANVLDGNQVDEPVVANPGDERVAQQLVLISDDLPEGWISEPHTSDARSDRSEEDYAACLGRPDPDAYRTADVRGHDFLMGEGNAALTVHSTASVVATREDAVADVDALNSDRFEPCKELSVEQALGRELPAGVRVATAVEAVPGLRSFGDATLHFRYVLKVEGPERAVFVHGEEVFMSKGRNQVLLTFTSTGKQFPADLRQPLIDAVGARLEAAGA